MLNKTTKTLILGFILLLSQSIYASDDSSSDNTSADNTSAKEVDGKLNPSFFRFQYSQLGVNIDHAEKSSNGSFSPLNETSKFKINIFDFIMGRELFYKNLFSISAFGVLRLNYGSVGEDDIGTNQTINFSDRLQGVAAGAGISLNINGEFLGNNTQVFISTQSMKAQDNYFLRYEDESNTERSLEIETKEISTVIQSSIGVRFMNAKKNFSSTLAFNVHQYNIDSLDVGASQGSDTDFTLSEEATIKKEGTSITLGLGTSF
jgi:hypothetical protein